MFNRLQQAVALIVILTVGLSAQVGWADEPASAPIPPTLVTVQINDGVAHDIFADLYKQAGLHLETMPANLWKEQDMQRAVSLNVDKVPFWEAMRQACEKTGLGLQPMMDPTKPLVLGKDSSSWVKKPAIVSGPFLVVANGVSGNKYLDYGNAPSGNSSVGINFTVYAEPRLRLASYQMMMKPTEAVDEQGHSLLPADAGPASSSMMSLWGRYQWGPTVSLKWPAEGVRKLARLKGTFTATFITKTQVWEIPDPLSAQELTKTIGKVTYVLHEMKKNDQPLAGGDTYSAKFSYKPEGGNDKAKPQIDPTAALRGAQLIDGDGKLLTSNGMSSVKNDIVLMFYVQPQQAMGDPVKLTVEVPTETQTVEIPVEFKDLPLP